MWDAWYVGVGKYAVGRLDSEDALTCGILVVCGCNMYSKGGVVCTGVIYLPSTWAAIKIRCSWYWYIFRH